MRQPEPNALLRSSHTELNQYDPIKQRAPRSYRLVERV